ncbi:MAG: type II toxin-antitoxin system prevent-host-death family antitoxin [Rhodospirillaceae bacterium]|nr:type II toxin-antitoxin system prevent-host-death family antitoxin [Rhodospirillaceae bacterium]
MGTVRKVGMFEAKTHFSALVEEVRNGGEIEITKRGETVAKLVPQPKQRDLKRVEDAINGLIELRKKQFLNGLTLKDLRDAGRKY